jgi:hypothetical protein
MSRSRNIKPGFFKNDLLAELPFEFRILFQGLWCEADREGRLLDRPKRLKAEIFPYDDVEVGKGLNMLDGFGFIQRYSVAGVGYIQITNFTKHQNPHKKEAPSEIPGPELAEHCASTVQDPEIPERAALIPDSPFLIPDSSVKATVQPAAAPKPASLYSESFEAFWTVYPNKKDKKDAYRAWKKDGCDAVLADLIAHVRLMQEHDDGWKRGYVPMGSTYLNGRRWEDVPKGPTRDKLSKTAQAMMTLENMSNELDGGRNKNGFPEIDMPRLGSPARFGTFGGNGNGVG